MMALFESKAAKIIDKLNEKKFKIKMLLAFMDLWDIVDGFEKPPPSNADPKVLKASKNATRRHVHHRPQFDK